MNDVPKRLNVIANEALVRTGPTARNLIISSSGATEKADREKIFLLNLAFGHTCTKPY
jgi:hypothetical protein